MRILFIAVLELFGIFGFCQEPQMPIHASPDPSVAAPKRSGPGADAEVSPLEMSACKENAGYCFDAGPFLARLMQVTDGVEGTYNVVRLNLQLENLTHGTLVLAYRAHTSILVDEFGNTYFCCTAKTAPDTSATGIAVNQGEVKDTDSQLALEAGQSGSITFSVEGHRAHAQESPYFHYDLTIEEMDPNNLRRVQRQYGIYFGDFTATWHTIRQKTQAHDRH